jgi:peptidoglycan/xylan/chitin deacetylase (PgdA/CDA1 family)
VKALSLMYHDVVEEGLWDSSGFSGPGAAVYKLAYRDFEKHLDAIRSALAGRPVGLVDQASWNVPRWPVFLTFDDGGASAATHIAPALEARGWLGHFFITTDRLGDPTFLRRQQVAELRKRGHVIGSHSCSHPPRISQCSGAELARQWRESAQILSQLIGEPVTIASVPGGFYSRRVAEAAAGAGIRYLFTSEPTASIGMVDGCAILGRYYLQRGMAPETAAAFALGRRSARFRQALLWKTKSAAKILGGGLYAKVREIIFQGSMKS